jgi:predicted  nucleic acid-binding Zn-ribbon protein
MFKLFSDTIGASIKNLLQIALLLIVLLSIFAGYLFLKDEWKRRQSEIAEYSASIKRDELARVKIDEEIQSLNQRKVELKKQLGPSMQKFKHNMDVAKKGFNEAKMEVQECQKLVKEKAEEIRKAKERIDELQEWINRVVAWWDDSDAIEKKQDELSSAKKAKEDLEKKMADFQRKAEEYQNEINKAAKDLIRVDAKGAEDLKKIDKDEDNLNFQKESLLSRLQSHRDKIASLKEFENKVKHYYTQSKNKYLPTVILIIFSIMLGPLCWRIFAFAVWGRFMAWIPPITFESGPLPAIVQNSNNPSLSIALSPNERLLVRPEFLLSSDESLKRVLRWMLNKKFPLTSIAAGLHELIELQNREREDLLTATLAHQRNADVELTEIAIPQGGSLILRPTFLAGFISIRSKGIRFRTRWNFGVHSLRTLQFRHFEFIGPCRLIVWGHRGVRMEHSSESLGWRRRINAFATIGFTPNLSRSSIRTEHLWLYLRGKNPLFDDFFSGEHGSFLSQRVAQEDASTSQSGLFWGRMWNGLCKVLGI